MHDRELLFELSAAAGPVGYEDDVRDVVREALAPEVDRIDTDAMGNVVGTVDGECDREVVVAAHMDEIGFVVSRVTDDGFLKLDALGGLERPDPPRAASDCPHGRRDSSGRHRRRAGPHSRRG